MALAAAATRLIATKSVFFNIGASSSATALLVLLGMSVSRDRSKRKAFRERYRGMEARMLLRIFAYAGSVSWSHVPPCSPNTIPNSPTRAMMGGAGLFTRMTPYRIPTSVPTANEMSSAFIANSLQSRLPYRPTVGDRCGGTDVRMRLRMERSHVAAGLLLQNLSSVHTSVETEYLFRFRVPGSHPAVCVHGFFKWHNLNRGRLQYSRFKTGLELTLDFRYLSRG